MKKALCAYHPSPEIFHPGKGGSKQVLEAYKVCMVCPVRTDCYDYSQRVGAKEGVWGGQYFKREKKT